MSASCKEVTRKVQLWVNVPMVRESGQECVINPAILSVPSALIARIAVGRGVSRSLNFSTVPLSIAEVVAPESNNIKALWRMSMLEGGPMSPDT